MENNAVETSYPGYYYNPSYPRYGIAINGDVIDISKGGVPLRYIKYASKTEPVCIMQTATGVSRTPFRSRIIAETFVPMPEELVNSSIKHVVFIDGNSNNLSLDNLRWGKAGEWFAHYTTQYYAELRKKWGFPEFDDSNTGLYPNAVACQYKQGFYYLPGVEEPIVIDKDGNFFNLEDNKFITQRITMHGYVTCDLRVIRKDGSVIRKPYRVHQAVALLFCSRPDTDEVLVPNHKDGNKQNNHYKNLEWITHQENSWHAIETGLTKVRWILVKDIRTNEITRYSSCGEVNKALGIAEVPLSKRLKNGNAAIHTYKWHVFKYEDEVEKDGWPDIPEENKVENSWNKLYRSVKDAKPFKIKVISLKNGKESVFPSLNTAARYTGVNNATLSYRLKCYGDDITYDKYRFIKLEETSLSSSQVKAWEKLYGQKYVTA